MGSPSLSVIIPARNEARRLPRTLDHLRAWSQHRADVEIVVVDDRSSDDTARIAERTGARLVRVAHGGGKGAAVRVGLEHARGERRLFTDADLSTPIEACALLEAAVDGGADVAVGLRRDDTRTAPLGRVMAGASFHGLVRLCGLTQLADTQCGFKLFSAHAARQVLPRARVDGFAFDVELLRIAHRQGLRVVGVPVPWMHDRDSRVGVVTPAQMLFDTLRILRRDRRGDYG
jgi:dolichyl-phosphate beta-glucosyltransferase